MGKKKENEKEEIWKGEKKKKMKDKKRNNTFILFYVKIYIQLIVDVSFSLYSILLIWYTSF